jgi:hypothetical protein
MRNVGHRFGAQVDSRRSTSWTCSNCANDLRSDIGRLDNSEAAHKINEIALSSSRKLQIAASTKSTAENQLPKVNACIVCNPGIAYLS